MEKEIIADRFAEMWVTSRMDAHKSQDYMAKAMGVSKKTIQNWESGYSCPNQREGFEWFQKLGLQPLPYYMRILYPGYESLTHESGEKEIEEMLFVLIRDLPHEAKRKMLYILSGEHGSSSPSVIDMVVAHLQTPLRDRLNTAQAVILNYEIAQMSGSLSNADRIQPNMDRLKSAFDKAKESVTKGQNRYTNF